MSSTIVDLHEAVPDIEIDFKYYWTFERNVAEPALENAGYVDIGNWFSTERDSFGPLGRGVMATNSTGERVLICYG